MDKELLRQAQQRLRIRDVYQVASQAKLAEGYDPTQDSGDQQPVIQFKHLVRESVVLEPDNGSDAPDLFRVYIDLGVRWRLADEAERKWQRHTARPRERKKSRDQFCKEGP